MALALLAPGAARADMIAAVQVTGRGRVPRHRGDEREHRRAGDAPRGHQHRRAGAAPEHQQGREAAGVPAARSRGGDAARDRAGHLDGPDRGPVQRFRGCDAAAHRPRDRPRRQRRLHRGAVRPGGERRLPRGGRLHAAGQLPGRPVQPRHDPAAVQLRPPGQHLASERRRDLHRVRGGAAGLRAQRHPQPAGRQLVEPAPAHGPRLQPSRDRGHQPAAGAARRPAAERRAGRHRVPPRDDRGPARHADRAAGDRELRRRVAAGLHAGQPLRRVCPPPQGARPPVRVGQPDPDAAEHRRHRPRRPGDGADRQPLALLPPGVQAHGDPAGDRDRQSPGGERRRAVRAAHHRDAAAPRQARLPAPHRRPLPAGELQEGQAAQALELHASTGSACGPAATSSACAR